jgi:hypothetical protein
VNCVQGNNYEDWMSEHGYNDWYLFGTAVECCEAWYPERTGKGL